jgi:DNA polymerase-4
MGRQPAVEAVFKPALRHLADRVASRLRAKGLAGRTVTVRVRFADMRAVTRSVTLDAPISATTMLAEIAEDLVRVALADHPRERIITLLAVSVSHICGQSELQLELPLGLPGEKHRAGTRQSAAGGRQTGRWTRSGRASAGKRSATRPSRSTAGDRCRTLFARWLRRISAATTDATPRGPVPTQYSSTSLTSVAVHIRPTLVTRATCQSKVACTRCGRAISIRGRGR